MSPGGVFNIAITVNGKYPIQASVTPIKQENILELVSEDQMVTEAFSCWEDLYQNMDVQWLIEYIFIIDTNKPWLVKRDNLMVLYIYANEFE